jgi:hypothetical protein
MERPVNEQIIKKSPVEIALYGAFEIQIIRRYLLSHLQYYHRLGVLNYCVRDGNRCDHYDMVAGRNLPSLFASADFIFD